MANIAPLVNTRGPLLSIPQGIVKRTHFHALAMYANELESRVGKLEIEADQLAHDGKSVPVVDAIATVNESGQDWAIALVNRHPSKKSGLHRPTERHSAGRQPRRPYPEGRFARCVQRRGASEPGRAGTGHPHFRAWRRLSAAPLAFDLQNNQRAGFVETRISPYAVSDPACRSEGTGILPGETTWTRRL